MRLSYSLCPPPVAAGLALAVGVHRLKERCADLKTDFGRVAGGLLRDAQINFRVVPVEEGRYPRMSVTAPARVFADVMVLAADLQQPHRLVREYAIEVGARDLFDTVVRLIEHAEVKPGVREVAEELSLDGAAWATGDR